MNERRSEWGYWAVARFFSGAMWVVAAAILSLRALFSPWMKAKLLNGWLAGWGAQ
jgi:hypothetical protein